MCMNATKKSQNGACCLDREKVHMIIDCGCSRTLVHENFVNG